MKRGRTFKGKGVFFRPGFIRPYITTEHDRQAYLKHLKEEPDIKRALQILGKYSARVPYTTERSINILSDLGIPRGEINADSIGTNGSLEGARKLIIDQNSAHTTSMSPKDFEEMMRESHVAIDSLDVLKPPKRPRGHAVDEIYHEDPITAKDNEMANLYNITRDDPLMRRTTRNGRNYRKYFPKPYFGPDGMFMERDALISGKYDLDSDEAKRFDPYSVDPAFSDYYGYYPDPNNPDTMRLSYYNAADDLYDTTEETQQILRYLGRLHLSDEEKLRLMPLLFPHINGEPAFNGIDITHPPQRRNSPSPPPERRMIEYRHDDSDGGDDDDDDDDDLGSDDGAPNFAVRAGTPGERRRSRSNSRSSRSSDDDPLFVPSPEHPPISSQRPSRSSSRHSASSRSSSRQSVPSRSGSTPLIPGRENDALYVPPIVYDESPSDQRDTNNIGFAPGAFAPGLAPSSAPASPIPPAPLSSSSSSSSLAPSPMTPVPLASSSSSPSPPPGRRGRSGSMTRTIRETRVTNQPGQRPRHPSGYYKGRGICKADVAKSPLSTIQISYY